jgi:arylsulfatase A-like enzyme
MDVQRPDPQRPARGRRLPLALAVAALLLGCQTTERPARIVLVVIDTLRDDHVGGTTTPQLDALAARGKRLPGALASFHQTTMSMAALFTGRTPSLERAGGVPLWNGQTWCGLGRLRTTPESRCVPAEATTLAEALGAVGYYGIGVASNPLMFDPSGYSQGFDRWVEVGRSPAAAAAPYAWSDRSWPKVRSALQGVLAEAPTTDVFLYVHLMEVHDFELRGATYAASVGAADTAVGELVALLEAWAGLQDTLLVVTSDHGERLREDVHVLRGKRAHFGDPSFEELLRVPLIVVPRLFETPPAAPLRSDDVNRLVARLAGAEAVAPDLAAGELFLGEHTYRTYRDGRFKSFDPRAGGPLVLLDLAEDPRERRDVAPLHPEVVARHRARTAVLVEALAAADVAASGALSDDERARLESLGYLTPDAEAQAGAP